MKKLILPAGMHLAEEPVKKSNDMKPGVAIGLVFLFLGVVVFAYPFIVTGMADNAKMEIRQRALIDKKAHPEKKIKLMDYATPKDISIIRYDSELDIGRRMCVVFSFFLLFPLGALCIWWSVMGCSDMTIGEIVVGAVAGHLAYKGIKKLLK